MRIYRHTSIDMFGCDTAGLGYFLQLVGAAFTFFVVVKYTHAFYQRMIVPAKEPLQYGKWALITGKQRCMFDAC